MPPAPEGIGDLSDIVNLPAGSSITYAATCSILASASGSLVNTATVSAPAGITDGNAANDSATDTDTLVPTSDLGVTKSNGSTELAPGTQTTYTIVVTNAGPATSSVRRSPTTCLPRSLVPPGVVWRVPGRAAPRPAAVASPRRSRCSLQAALHGR